MSIFKMAEAYIQKHATNLGTDVIQHLKAFAVHAEATLKAETPVIVADVKAEVKGAESYTEEKAHAVESALEEVKAHTETAFADLLAAQTVKTETPTESKE